MGTIASVASRIHPSDKMASRLIQVKKKSDSISLLNKFIRIVLLNSGPYNSLRTIVCNHHARDEFARFLIGRHRRFCVRYFELKFVWDDSVLIEIKNNLCAISEFEIMSSSSELVKFCSGVIGEFLYSDFFAEWRRKEELDLVSINVDSVLVETTLPELQTHNSHSIYDALSTTKSQHGAECLVDLEVNMSPSERCAGLILEATALPAIQGGKSLKSCAQLALENCDQVAVSSLLRTDCWLLVFLSAAETLPVGITLSTVTNSRPNFPFVYTNDAYLKLSGSSRERVLGRPCHFMTSGTLHLSDQAQTVAVLNSAAENAEAVVAVITSRRENGEIFTNLVGLKPVVDYWNRYRYLITLQLDVSSSENLLDSCHLMKSMVDGLPEMLCPENSLINQSGFRYII